MAVRWLLVAALAGLGGSSPRRAAILKAVSENPGIHKSELQRLTGLSWGSISHHISALHRSKRIHSLRHQGRLSLFPASVDEPMHAAFAAFRQPLARDIAREIQARPRIRLMELSRRIAVPRKRVTRILESLHDQGLVNWVGESRREYLWTGPDLNHIGDEPAMTDLGSDLGP